MGRTLKSVNASTTNPAFRSRLVDSLTNTGYPAWQGRGLVRVGAGVKNGMQRKERLDSYLRLLDSSSTDGGSYDLGRSLGGRNTFMSTASGHVPIHRIEENSVEQEIRLVVSRLVTV